MRARGPVESSPLRRALALLACATACGGEVPEVPTGGRDLTHPAARVLEEGDEQAWWLQPTGEAQLALAGAADRPGTLALALAPVDVATGRTGEPLTELALPVSGEPLVFALPVPDRGVLRLAASWSGTEAPSAFTLSRLSLVEQDAPARPPILLITIDTLAARNMSVYGYPRATTPALERFAADAVVFEQCRANATWTLPSFLSVLTGLYPFSHRIDHAPGTTPALWESWFLRSERWTLAEELRSLGYRTAGFVDQVWLSERFGFDQGFEVLDGSSAELDPLDPAGGLRMTGAQGLAWIDEREAEQPFFLFVHAFDVHGPYHAAPPFQRSFRDDELARVEREELAGGLPNAYGVVPEYVTSAEYADDGLPSRVRTSRVRAAYDEGLAQTDAELGAFFEELEERGLYEDAVIVVTADHGETMERDHNLFGHGTLDDPVLHVPLLVKLPRGAFGGTRVRADVQLVDLYPTLVELARGRTLASARRDLHGRSLLPLIRGEAQPPRPSFSEGGIAKQSSIVLGGWKLIERLPGAETKNQPLLSHYLLEPLLLAERERSDLRDDERAFLARGERLLERLRATGLTRALMDELKREPGHEAFLAYLRDLLPERIVELYDLSNDPEEERDLAAERPDKVREMAALLAAERRRRDDARVQLSDRPATEGPGDLSREEQQRLEDLGYAGDE